MTIGHMTVFTFHMEDDKDIVLLNDFIERNDVSKMKRVIANGYISYSTTHYYSINPPTDGGATNDQEG